VWERYGESVPLLLSRALISICWWWLALSVRLYLDMLHRRGSLRTLIVKNINRLIGFKRLPIDSNTLAHLLILHRGAIRRLITCTFSGMTSAHPGRGVVRRWL
jgi:hypothetical protein